jgi:hypothetical protein
MREDFCGTASLAAHFASRHPDNRALGVDLDSATLEWGRVNRVALLGDGASRVTLLDRDVRDSAETDLEVVTAFNFSYWIFTTREAMRGYLETVCRSLRPGGRQINDFGRWNFNSFSNKSLKIFFLNIRSDENAFCHLVSFRNHEKSSCQNDRHQHEINA